MTGNSSAFGPAREIENPEPMLKRVVLAVATIGLAALSWHHVKGCYTASLSLNTAKRVHSFDTLRQVDNYLRGDCSVVRSLSCTSPG